MKDTYCAFDGQKFLQRGDKVTVLRYLKDYLEHHASADTLLVLNEQTAQPLELTKDIADITEMLEAQSQEDTATQTATQDEVTSRRGRPHLGVKAREITLLPRHWEWLKAQPKSASATLRLLVEQAIKNEPQQARVKREIASLDKIIMLVAGDAPHYEEVSRALYAQDKAGLEQHMDDAWHESTRAYVLTRYQAITS